MKFCQYPNYTGIWMYNGLNRCFQDVVTSSVLFIFMFSAGCYQCAAYRKYSRQIGPRFKPASCGLAAQFLFSLILLTETLIHIVLLDTTIGQRQVYGYQLYAAIADGISWIFSIKLLFLERDRALPSSKYRGHGLALLVFWSLVFIKESIYFLSWNNPTFYWQLKR